VHKICTFYVIALVSFRMLFRKSFIIDLKFAFRAKIQIKQGKQFMII